ITGLDDWVTPTVPQRGAAQHDPRRPDRSEVLQHLRQDGGGGNLPVGRKICQMIEKPAGSGFIASRKNGWRLNRDAAEPAQDVSAALDSGQRVAGAGLEAVD